MKFTLSILLIIFSSSLLRMHLLKQENSYLRTNAKNAIRWKDHLTRPKASVHGKKQPAGWQNTLIRPENVLLPVKQ